MQVEFDRATVERWRLLGYENRDVADRDFRNDAVDAGEIGVGHSRDRALRGPARDGAPGARPSARSACAGTAATGASRSAQTLQSATSATFDDASATCASPPSPPSSPRCSRAATTPRRRAGGLLVRRPTGSKTTRPLGPAGRAAHDDRARRRAERRANRPARESGPVSDRASPVMEAPEAHRLGRRDLDATRRAVHGHHLAVDEGRRRRAGADDGRMPYSRATRRDAPASRRDR